MSKMVHFGEFLKTCGQTVLPDKLILIGQNLVENAKIKNTKATFLVFFKQCAVYKTRENEVNETF